MRTTTLLATAALLATSCRLVEPTRPVPALETLATAGARDAARTSPARFAAAPSGFISYAQAAPEDERPSRLVVYTGSFSVLVPNVEDAVTRFLAEIESLGGYLAVRENEELVCRVPAERFHDAIALLPAFGRILRESIRALDVTEEYQDLELRIATAEETLQRLIGLLDRASNVEEVLAIEKEVHRLTEEIERMKGKLRLLASQISLSTLTVEFASNAPAPRPVRQRTQSPFPWIRRVGLTSVLEDF